jgi:hypothetical protein
VRKLVVVASLAVIAGMMLAAPASAHHSWQKYHWARTSNPFSLTLGNNTSSPWSSMLSSTSTSWNASTGPSTVLTTSVGRGDVGDPSTCDPTLGKVEVCNADYGNNGWLGLAQIWIYRGGSHIAQGVVELNDYYFKSGSTYAYNNSAEQLHVVCQEVGHTFGLDHQSETGASLDTCMDYYHNPSSGDTRSTRPNAGDFGELSCIYDPAYRRKVISSTIATTYASYTHTCKGTGHLDSFDSAGASPSSRASYFPHAKPSFRPGTRVAKDEYVDRLPNGGQLVTFVTPPTG